MIRPIAILPFRINLPRDFILRGPSRCGVSPSGWDSQGPGRPLHDVKVHLTRHRCPKSIAVRLASLALAPHNLTIRYRFVVVKQDGRS
jgi:hypothetical protein